jgi:hypothetical protein
MMIGHSSRPGYTGLNAAIALTLGRLIMPLNFSLGMLYSRNSKPLGEGNRDALGTPRLEY